jgi:hypothetical protein
MALNVQEELSSGNDVLHLQSGLPEHDDELSIDDSTDEEWDEAPQDSTYHMRT